MTEEKLPTQDADALGEMPEPQIEPREPNPGGADAMPRTRPSRLADLDPDKNPAIADDEVPDVLKEGEDTETEATKDSDGDDESSRTKSPRTSRPPRPRARAQSGSSNQNSHPLGRRLADADAAFVGADDLRDGGQADAVTGRVGEPGEHAEHGLAVGLGHSRAVVDDADPPALLGPPRLESDDSGGIPGRPNLTALLTRLSSTEYMRSPSAWTLGSEPTRTVASALSRAG